MRWNVCIPTLPRAFSVTDAPIAFLDLFERSIGRRCADPPDIVEFKPCVMRSPGLKEPLFQGCRETEFPLSVFCAFANIEDPRFVPRSLLVERRRS